MLVTSLNYCTGKQYMNIQLTNLKKKLFDTFYSAKTNMYLLGFSSCIYHNPLLYIEYDNFLRSEIMQNVLCNLSANSLFYGTFIYKFNTVSVLPEIINLYFFIKLIKSVKYIFDFQNLYVMFLTRPVTLLYNICRN